MSDFRTSLEQYIRREARPIEKYGHQPRLYMLTRQVGSGLSYDDDVVFAAAWLHDLGVFTGHRPEDPESLAAWDNTAYAMAKTPGLLEQFGFPKGKIPAVVETIRTHQATAKPNTIEGEILRDSDILEQLGAIGVLRTVCKIGRDTRFADFTSAVNSLRKALQTLPAQIHLDSARALAQRRIELLREFLANIEAEADGSLF